MFAITNITDSPSQNMTIRLENGQLLQMTIWYSYTQQGWFYTFTYGTYTVNNRRMAASLNMLRQIRNIIPFGLACLMTDTSDPVFITDFASGRATLYELNSTDVAQVETILQGLQRNYKP